MGRVKRMLGASGLKNQVPHKFLRFPLSVWFMYKWNQCLQKVGLVCGSWRHGAARGFANEAACPLFCLNLVTGRAAAEQRMTEHCK